MAIVCDALAEQMAILETEKAAVIDIIAQLQAAIAATTDPTEMMSLMMDLAEAYRIQSEIDYDISIVQMNQILLGCIPNPWGMPMADSPVETNQIATHEQLRKIQNARLRRKFVTIKKPFKIDEGKPN